MPFQAGQSGNPLGARKAKLWRETLMLTINRIEDGEPLPIGRTPLQRIIAKQVSMAIEGDGASIRDIADRLDGKPAQAIVGGDDDDNPVVIINRIERVLIDNANHRDRESIQTIIAAEPI